MIINLTSEQLRDIFIKGECNIDGHIIRCKIDSKYGMAKGIYDIVSKLVSAQEYNKLLHTSK